MPCFFKGALGAFLVLVAAAIIVPQYSDYLSAAETSLWLSKMEPVKMMVEENSGKLKTLNGAGRHIDKAAFAPNNVTFFEIRDSGEILLQGGRDGQFVMLTPTLDNGKISWRCLGGSRKAVHC